MDALRVILELGRSRRVVAGATDWPGLDRWAGSEADALAKIAAYVPRYAWVAARAGLAEAFARQGPPQVIERVPGSSSTDFWGIAHVPSMTELDVMLTPDGLGAHRARFVDAIRAYNADGRPARRWPIQFLIRRTAQHVMDHAWELEDRDLSGP